MLRKSKLNKGFTLVELLVVIGIIALLISILLPALNNARKKANTVKCLSTLRQYGNAFNQYAIDNKGWWPMARHAYNPTGSQAAPRTNEKRWYDFIGKYLNGGRLVNWDGSKVASATQDTIDTIRSKSNLLWGCPEWDSAQPLAYSTSTNPYTVSTNPNTLTADRFNGYIMNIYTFAPATVAIISASTTAGHPQTPGMGLVNWATLDDSSTPPALGCGGWYWKASQWKRPSERGLIWDSIHWNCSVTANWPWWNTGTWPGTNGPPVPDGATYTVDFNRHGKLKIGNSPYTKSMNMLFCDGHAETVSAREASHAIRFN